MRHKYRVLNKLSKVEDAVTKNSNSNKSNLKYLRKIRNKIKSSINGNIRNIIKITAWNKGSMELSSKIEEIKEIISDKKPNVLIVNELNLDFNDDFNITNINGYKFEVDKLYKKMVLEGLVYG